MKTQTTKAIRVIVPTLLGAAAVSTALWFESLLHGYFVTPEPYSDTQPPLGFGFYIFSTTPFILLALAFQAYFAISRQAFL
jgi:hypothetical protein